MPAYFLCCAASSLASVDCFCRSSFSGSGICLSRGGIFSLPLDSGFGTLVCWAVVAARYEIVVVGLMKGTVFGGMMSRFSVYVEWCACALL